MHSMPSASATARRARSTFTPATARGAELVAEALRVGTGHLQVLLEAHALGLEAHGEVLEAVLHLVVDQRLGHLVGDELGQGLADLLAPAIEAWARRTRTMRSSRLARSSPTVSNSEASAAHSSSTSGSTFSCTVLDRAR